MRVVLLPLSLVLLGCAHHRTTPQVPPPSQSPPQASTTVGVEVVFSEDEIRIIRAYYETHSTDSRKGKGLPPGIAKNLARGKPLPPGIAKQFLPYDLRRELPPPPDGYERIVVAGKVLLVELATQIVRDILTEAVSD
jgi:hypothetical protein